MRLQTSNSNQPNWHSITVSAELPQQLKPLEELSKNLWWVWNSKGKSLFHDLDPDLWRRYGQNPVMLLQNLSYARLEEILADKAWMDRINSVYASFRTYMDEPLDKNIPSVAYLAWSTACAPA